MRWLYLLSLLPLLCLASCMQMPPGAGGLPDPRYRRPLGVWEIDRVAQRVADQCGCHLAGPVRFYESASAPVASLRSTVQGEQLILNPRAAREIPPNAWAFIFGHEFAHRVHRFGTRGHTDPQQELRADIIGARYAIDSGFHLESYLQWMLSRPVRTTASHGSLHWRARELGRYYGARF